MRAAIYLRVGYSYNATKHRATSIAAISKNRIGFLYTRPALDDDARVQSFTSRTIFSGVKKFLKRSAMADRYLDGRGEV